jgi:hypothetical protein
MINILVPKIPDSLLSKHCKKEHKLIYKNVVLHNLWVFLVSIGYCTLLNVLKFSCFFLSLLLKKDSFTRLGRPANRFIGQIKKFVVFLDHICF